MTFAVPISAVLRIPQRTFFLIAHVADWNTCGPSVQAYLPLEGRASLRIFVLPVALTFASLRSPVMPIVPNSPTAPIPGAGSRDAACLIVRVVAGLTMILYNSWLMVQQGWNFLWNKGDWALLQAVTDLGFPLPTISACVIAAIFFFGSIFLILGVFGRATAIVLLLTTELGFYFALREGAVAYVELSILYATLYLLNIVLGSGRYSADRFLAGLGRQRFRRKNPSEF